MTGAWGWTAVWWARQIKFVDWVLVNQTIDVTKTARLIARVVQKVKWDESDNPDLEIRSRYRDLQDVELKTMTFEAIFANNDFEEELAEHMNVYGQYIHTRIDDYERFKVNPIALRSQIPVADAGTTDDDQYVLDMPYTEGQALPDEHKYGIQTVQEWASEQGIISVSDDIYEDLPDDDDRDDDDDEKVLVQERVLMATLRDVDLRGYMVHTEYGPGLVTRSTFPKSSSSTPKFEVAFRDSYDDRGWSTASIAKGKCFVYKDSKRLNLPKGGPASWSKRAIEEIFDNIPEDMIQEQIAQDLGVNGAWTGDYADYEESPIPQTPIEDDAEEDEIETPPGTPDDEAPVNYSIELHAMAVNDRIALSLEAFWDPEDDENEDLDYGGLEALGFRHIGPFAYAHIQTRTQMETLYDRVSKLADKDKIFIPRAYWQDFERIYEARMESRSKAAFLDTVSQQELRNFYLLEIRKGRDPNTVNLAMVIEDGEVYAMINYAKNRRGLWLANRAMKGIEVVHE